MTGGSRALRRRSRGNRPGPILRVLFAPTKTKPPWTEMRHNHLQGNGHNGCRKLGLGTYHVFRLLRKPSSIIKRWAVPIFRVLRARVIWELCKETFSEWYQDNVPRLAAVLSFYTIFSLAPTLIIVLAVAASVVGESTAQAEIMARFRYFIGPEAARAILAASEKARTEFSGLSATVISLTTLL